MKKLMLVTAIAALMLAACANGDSEGSGPETLPTAPPNGTETTVPDATQVEPGDSLPPSGDEGQDLPGKASDVGAMVDAAVADLANRLPVDPQAITVTSVESVTWRDGSMGCPEPGMSYTQALVDGVRVELTVDGTSYWYHQGGSNPIRYCADPREPLESSPDA
jgi:hypothetical protein